MTLRVCGEIVGLFESWCMGSLSVSNTSAKLQKNISYDIVLLSLVLAHTNYLYLPMSFPSSAQLWCVLSQTPLRHRTEGLSARPDQDLTRDESRHLQCRKLLLTIASLKVGNYVQIFMGIPPMANSKIVKYQNKWKQDLKTQTIQHICIHLSSVPLVGMRNYSGIMDGWLRWYWQIASNPVGALHLLDLGLV